MRKGVTHMNTWTIEKNSMKHHYLITSLTIITDADYTHGKKDL